MSTINTSASNVPSTNAQEVIALTQKLYALADKALKIKEHFDQLANAGVSRKTRTVTTVETEGSITTTTIAVETVERVDETERSRKLREAAEGVPALVENLLKGVEVKIGDVTITRKELEEIRDLLSELGLGNILSRIINNNSNDSIINMDALNEILNAGISAGSSNGTSTKSEESTPRETTEPLPENRNAPTRRDFFKELFSKSKGLIDRVKSSAGGVVARHAVSAVQAHIGKANDAELAKLVRKLFGY